MNINVSYKTREARYSRVVSVYVQGVLSKEHRTNQIRDRLAETPRIPTDRYKKIPAHITILPRARTTEDTVQQVISEVKTTMGDIDSKVSINGAGVWPHFQNPAVILLDANPNWQTKQQKLYSKLQANSNIEFSYPPSKPHCTLLKRELGNVGLLNRNEKERLQKWIQNHRASWTTKLDSIQVEIEKAE